MRNEYGILDKWLPWREYYAEGDYADEFRWKIDVVKRHTLTITTETFGFGGTEKTYSYAYENPSGTLKDFDGKTVTTINYSNVAFREVIERSKAATKRDDVETVDYGSLGNMDPEDLSSYFISLNGKKPVSLQRRKKKRYGKMWETVGKMKFDTAKFVDEHGVEVKDD